MVSNDDIVRVLRVYEFVGPREWVEPQVQKSIHGTREIGPGKFIRGATVGDYPELLSAGEYEAHFEKVTVDEVVRMRSSYDK